jgi:hypothetical protein
MNYRINYGNGQVFELPTLAAARREFDRYLSIQVYSSAARIQRYVGDGEWVTVRTVGQ